MLKLIEKLGAAFMFVFHIKEVKTPAPDADLQPSEGRSFINFDSYNPDILLDRREEMGVLPNAHDIEQEQESNLPA